MDESQQPRQVELRTIWVIVLAVAAIQVTTWLLAGGASWRPAFFIQVIAGWAATVVLAVMATRRIGRLSERLAEKEHAHRTTLAEIEQLQTQNAMLDIVARSVDVPLTFQALAHRIARVVPCDRVGLALLTEKGQEFVTYTARVHEHEQRGQPRPDVMFEVERTAIGTVVRSTRPMLIADTRTAAMEFVDANVILTAGFRSAIVMPLLSNGRGVGTLNVVARQKNAFTPAHVEALRPIAEILAVAHVVQQLHMLVGRYRSTEAMVEATLAIAAEMNSALQTIVGHCDLLARAGRETDMRRDLDTMKRQAQRIAELLEQMRTAAKERLQEVTSTIEEQRQPGAPTPPLT